MWKKRNIKKITIILFTIVILFAYFKSPEIDLSKLIYDDDDFNTAENIGFIKYNKYGTSEPLSFKINNTGKNNSLIVYAEYGEYSNGAGLGNEEENGRINITIKYKDHTVSHTGVKKKKKIPLEKNSSCIVIFEGVEYIINKGDVFNPKIYVKQPRITKFKFDKKEMEISYIRYPRQGWIIKQK